VPVYVNQMLFVRNFTESIVIQSADPVGMRILATRKDSISYSYIEMPRG
jgi:hypothetical protein